jgi:hypothetical protein
MRDIYENSEAKYKISRDSQAWNINAVPLYVLITMDIEEITGYTEEMETN